MLFWGTSSIVCGYSKAAICSPSRTPSHFIKFSLRTITMSSGNDSKKRPVGRRYIVACDGTWQNSDMGYDKSLTAGVTPQIPTNVTRISRAIARNDGPIQQIVYYQRGIASSDMGVADKLLGGLTGLGISEHIREAYSFLANNFSPSTQKSLDDVTVPLDEIVLLGFSRGAFTARAISSLISDIGLLTDKGMESFWGIFGDWTAQDVEGEKGKWFKSVYGEQVGFTDGRYKQRLIDDGLTRWGMPIRAVGVWDTVGALGIPLAWHERNVKNYSFVNTKVAQKVQYAFHAMALDEHRNLFTPTMWEQPDQPHNLRKLKQCWFPGVHSNIGGSYPDAGISNITLAWMISQLEDTEGGLVAFNASYLDFVQDKNNERYATVPEPIRPWGMGRLYDSAPKDTATGLLQGMSPITRTPGRYFKISNEDGKPTKQRLKNTQECIHRCVRVRINSGGRATEDDADTSKITKAVDWAKGVTGHSPPKTYVCDALANYTLVQPDALTTEVDHSAKGKSQVVWKAKDGGDDLFEDELGETEIRMLRRSVETANAAKSATDKKGGK